MATGNYVQLSTTTHSNSGEYYGGGMTAPANFSYSYDGDTGTAYGASAYRGGGGDWGYYIYIISSHHFYTPKALSSIYYKLYARTNAYGNYPNGSYYMYVQISYDSGSNWTTIYSSSGGANSGEVTVDTTTTGTWNSVTDIRAIVYAAAGGDRDGYCGAYIYEIQAIGTLYSDIGLRIRKNGVTYKIGAETLTASHKLRFRDGATTYGIPLLSVSDINASTLRIYDGANTKALPLATE